MRMLRRLRLAGVPVFCIALLAEGGGTPLSDGPFVANPVLGRPTDTSVTISLVPTDSIQVYVEFGTMAPVYSRQTVIMNGRKDIPLRFTLGGLAANTRYSYRVRYREPAAPEFASGAEHTFMTQRSPGSTFRFTIEADPHPYDKKGSHTLWQIALANQLADSGDFLLDLGDTFGDDHNPFTITSAELCQLHLDCLPYFGLVCHSSPLFLCLGNHEGESGYYLLQSPPDNLAVNATIWRKYYYANPVPDGFYSGNSVAEAYGIGLPENTYAWKWGDALFVVLDAYRGYTASAKPRGWEWTLGATQYAWLRQTLEESDARYKFVFAHHILGETRGGVGVAKFYEWGGYEGDGTWGFPANRAGWAMPVHQLMAAHGVTIFFQGHDHLFAQETLDGVVYQEVPMPSDSTYMIGMLANADAYTSNQLGGSGHLRVTVAPESVKVDYVQAYLPADEGASHRNGQVAYSYTVKPTVADTVDEVLLPGGDFDMGDHYGFVDPSHPSDELPIHTVEVNSFLMGRTEITNTLASTLLNAAYAKGLIEVRGSCVFLPGGVDTLLYLNGFASYSSIGWNGTAFSVIDFRANHPLVGVMWKGAAAMCNWLSQRRGLQECYDLATWACNFARDGYRLPTEAE